MNDQFKLYASFTKRDDDQHLVSGFASSEVVDSQGEVVKADALARALPEYMKWGNIREMHQWSAVGKAVQAMVNPDNKMFLVAKVVDKSAWEKCKEGVYNGFSIGGRVVKKIGNVIEELVLNEISLVDRPANPEAIFTMVKIDHDKVMDMQVDNEDALVKAEVLKMANDLRKLLNDSEAHGKPTQYISDALTSLKKLADQVLVGEDKGRFEKILYQIDFKEIAPNPGQGQLKKNEEDKVDLQKVINSYWMPGYFEDLRKVLK
jgi:hypothetical protein